MTSWKGRPFKVEYLSILDGEVQPAPNFKPNGNGKPKDAKPTSAGGWIGRRGPCCRCGRETLVRVDDDWCCIPCHDGTG